MPELIQDAATPQSIMQKLQGILASPIRLEKMKEELEKVKRKVGGPGASEELAKRVMEYLKK